jgi:integrase
VAARAAAAGLEGDFAGHSLRAGFATAAARAGRSEAAIMRHGRWKSVRIARRYIRQGARWDDTPRLTSDSNRGRLDRRQTLVLSLAQTLALPP